jgi:glycosyltransferase involved in cell wall biosynthesis
MLFGDGVPRDIHLTERFRLWLDEFRPELIYSFLGSMAQIRMTRRLVRHSGAALAVHLMDDWPEVIYRRGALGPFLRRIVLKEFEELLRDAALRFGICDQMCKEYEKRYGYSFLPFHNSLEIDQWTKEGRKSWAAKQPFLVRYAGSILNEGQRESLRDVCTAIDNMARAGVSIRMEILSPLRQSAYLTADRFSSLRLAEPPFPDKIVTTLAEADVLVLPFNFDSNSARFLRFSMPTKMPAYMASGSPVLVYGPPQIAPVEVAASQGWALVVAKRDVAELEGALRILMENSGLRERLSRTGQRLARQMHDASEVRPRFQSLLARCLKA